MAFAHISHYIDPGTGSMLFTLLIGLVTTGYFFLRKVIIKLRFMLSGGSGKSADQGKLPYVIFSDHKRYWNVFKPICDEFERRGVDLHYWTASPDDPALEAPYEHVTCEFIGEGNKAFARLNMMNADIVLSTTPGLDVLQWKRSKDASWYVHTLHAVGSAAGYRMFGLDYYDAVLLSGQFQVDEVRELERLRDLPPKEIEIVGCTYLDVMAERLEGLEPPRNERPCVLLAPSWGASSILSVYGSKIIDALLATGYEVVIRPHPQSMTAEKELLEGLMAAYPDSDDLSWNFDNDNFAILNRADIMISDFSGVVFDYTLVFDKPVIFTKTEFDNSVYDAAWLEKPLWKFSVYPTLGVELSEEQFPEMRDVIDRVIADRTLAEGRERAREQAWAHRGESVERTVDYLIKKHGELAARTEEA
ncbi:MAG: CDP-glycerol glycerophosphotransferase family protein [Atopobiaceae bacterium]|nr:CDP-glycerol glycerophosphotransferase family protein [Atopobiaceae bacterium]